ncbi:MAG: hypothetical protein ACRD9R_01560 [Pyrinomonadaceae bacterium]
MINITTAAQQTNIEYGQAGELNGVVKLFIFTDADMQARAELVKELVKRLPQVEIIETPEAADVHLIYRSETLHVPSALTWISEFAPVSGVSTRQGYDGGRTIVVASQLAPVVVGTGVVLKIIEPGRVRLLMSFRGESLAGSFARSPRTNFVRAFVKEYKRANPPRARAR